MSCPREYLIVRLIGSELPGAEERALREHLAECPLCAQTLEEIQYTWAALRTWNVDTNVVDLMERVEAEIREPPDRHRSIVALFKSGQLRVAASIALASGLGIATGMLAPRDPALQGSLTSSVPSTVEVAEGLGLAELATPSATGLPLGFEPAGPDGTEGEP